MTDQDNGPPPKSLRRPDVPMTAVTLDGMLDTSLMTLYRDVNRLYEESDKRKLAPASAIQLRENIKLLMSLKDKELEKLKELSDEDLAKIADEDDD